MIGPNFPKELEDAGLAGLPITYGADGDVQYHGLTEAQEAILQAVINAHDPLVPNLEIRIEEIKGEAQRRIIALFEAPDFQASATKQMNTLKRATALLYKQGSGGGLTADELAEMASLNQLGEKIDAIRAASNELETTLPDNFTDDQYWPN